MCSTKRHSTVCFYTRFSLPHIYGFVISLWPNIIPPSVSIWQSAAPESSMKFALVATVILIPIILIYTFLSYWVFRDKVRIGDEGYH